MKTFLFFINEFIDDKEYALGFNRMIDTIIESENEMLEFNIVFDDRVAEIITTKNDIKDTVDQLYNNYEKFMCQCQDE